MPRVLLQNAMGPIYFPMQYTLKLNFPRISSGFAVATRNSKESVRLKDYKMIYYKIIKKRIIIKGVISKR